VAQTAALVTGESPQRIEYGRDAGPAPRTEKISSNTRFAPPQVARALGVSRNTIKQILRKQATARDTGHSVLAPPTARAPYATKIDTYAPRVLELLDKYPDITAQRVFETLRDEGFEGGYGGDHDHGGETALSKEPQRWPRREGTPACTWWRAPPS